LLALCEGDPENPWGGLSKIQISFKFKKQLTAPFEILKWSSIKKGERFLRVIDPMLLRTKAPSPYLPDMKRIIPEHHNIAHLRCLYSQDLLRY